MSIVGSVVRYHLLIVGWIATTYILATASREASCAALAIASSTSIVMVWRSQLNGYGLLQRILSEQKRLRYVQPEKTEDVDETVSLTQAAMILGKKVSNTAQFLHRHGVFPVIGRPYKRRWRRDEVQAAKDAYDESERPEQDRKRSEAARAKAKRS